MITLILFDTPDYQLAENPLACALCIMLVHSAYLPWPMVTF